MIELLSLPLILAAFITGLSKFSVGGMGMLILPIMLMVYPGPEALGVLVPMYILADVLVVMLHRQGSQWGLLAQITPTWIIGLTCGAWLIMQMDPSYFSTIIGILILAMIAFGFWVEKRRSNLMNKRFIAPVFGTLMGFTGMIASVGGPFLSLFLLGKQLDKEAYVSTRAWGFLFIDLLKLPLLWWMGLLKLELVTVALTATPALLVGALAGRTLLNRLDMSQLGWMIRVCAVIAAIKLLAFS